MALPMDGHIPLEFSSLPEDIIRSIADFCDLNTRCAARCTSSEMRLPFLGMGSVKLTETASTQFLHDEEFRTIMRKGVGCLKIRLEVHMGGGRIFSGDEIDIFSSLGSVQLNVARDVLDEMWLANVRLIRTLKGVRLIARQFPVGLETEAKSRERQNANVAVLARLTQLTYLDLSDSLVSDVSSLRDCTNLTHVYLNDTQVSDLSVFAGLTKVTHLFLRETQISNISVLANCKELTHLNLERTLIRDLSALANCKQMTHLYLSNTQVFDVAPLGNFTKLSYLDLANTHVSDVSPLANHKKFTYLNLSQTRVSDLITLEDLIDYLTPIIVRSVHVLDEPNLSVLILKR